MSFPFLESVGRGLGKRISSISSILRVSIGISAQLPHLGRKSHPSEDPEAYAEKGRPLAAQPVR